MNSLNRIKFFLRYMHWSFRSGFRGDRSFDCILWYINDNKLRKNKHYKLAIDTMFKWSNNLLLNTYRYGQFIDNPIIQQSESFDKIINILSSYNGYTVSVVPQVLDLADNNLLNCEKSFDDIVLAGFNFKNLESYKYYISLCENYYKYINSDTFDQTNLETINDNYTYMMKKFIELEDDILIKYYYKIFSKSSLLELEQYTDFIDRVFEIKEKIKLKLLDKLLDNCVKNVNIGVFPVLETVNKIENKDVLFLQNKIFSNPFLKQLKNLQLISLYISQIQDESLLYEFDHLLNNKTLVNSSCFSEIMTNAIAIRYYRTLQELNKFITYLGVSQEQLDIVNKLNYEDELLCDVLTETNYITNLLSDVRISLYVKKIEILLYELLAKKDYKNVLASLQVLKQEIEKNISDNMVITNTLKIIDLVDKTFKIIDEVDEKTKTVDLVEEKQYQKVLNNN